MSAAQESRSPPQRVGAVVVSYRPDPATLARVVAAAAAQVDHLVVVDNGSAGDPLAGFEGRIPANVTLHRLESNRGIAAAQNAGIAELRARGAAYALLLDQDSVCGPEMVARLVDAAEGLHAEGVPTSAVGPQYRATPGEPLSGFVRFGRMGCRRLWSAPDGGDVVEADFLISSGALLPLAALDRVGPMEEALFIDHVDTEWFLRARGAGLRCFGVCSAVMEHALGEGNRRVWLGRWRHIPDHRPFRYYYIVRNSVLLYRRSYAPPRWIAGDIVRLLVIGLHNLTIPGERLIRLRMMARGLHDGVVGDAGQATLLPGS